MAVLRVLANDGTGRALQTFALTQPDSVVGRAADATISIDDPSLSRHHARLVWTGQAWMAVELSTTNGIVVRGQRVSSHVLSDGDRLKLGHLELEYREQDPRDASTLAVDGEGAAALIAQVRAAKAAHPAYGPPSPAPPPAPMQAPAPLPSPPMPDAARSAAPAGSAPTKKGGVGTGLAIGLGVLLVLGGAGAGYWFVVRPGLEKRGPSPARTEGSTDGAEGDGPSTSGGEPPEPVPAPEPEPAEPAPPVEISLSADGGTASLPGGPTVQVPANAFPTGTRLSLGEVKPTGVALPPDAHLLSPMWQVDAAGKQPTRDMVFEVQLRDVPELAKDERVFVARADGGKLYLYPTYFDPETGRARATVDHLSVLLVIRVVVSVGGPLATGYYVYYQYAKDDEDPSTYPKVFMTKQGFFVHYHDSGPHEAPASPGPTTPVPGVPGYVVKVGEEMDRAIGKLRSLSQFKGLPVPGPKQLPHVFIRNTGGAGGNRILAWTSSSRHSLVFHRELTANELRATAPHELFHVVQLAAIGWQDNANEKLWSEMSAEWAASVAEPAAALPQISTTVVGNPGFASKGLEGELGQDEQYAAGELAIFLEGRCPGLMRGLYSSSSPLNPYLKHDPWFRSTSTQMKSTCSSASLPDLLHEYFARFYFVGGLKTGRAPKCYPGAGVTNDRPYQSKSEERPVASAQCLEIRSQANLRPGTLVVTARANRPEARASIVAWTNRSGKTPPAVYGGKPVIGYDMLASASKRMTMPDFGGLESGRIVNGAQVLFSQPTNSGTAKIDYEFWVVQAPENPGASYVTGKKRADDEVSVSWKASKLPKLVGTRGVLKHYIIMQKTSTGFIEVARVGPSTTTTKIKASAIQWTKRSATLVVRAKDRYDNLSPNSVEVSVQQPKPKPKPKPKPPANPCINNPKGPGCQE